MSADSFNWFVDSPDGHCCSSFPLRPDGPWIEWLVSVVLTSLFLHLLAPSCFLEPPVGMTHEAVQCHRKFQHPEGDHFTLINIYNAFKQSQREQCETQLVNGNKSALWLSGTCCSVANLLTVMRPWSSVTEPA